MSNAVMELAWYVDDISPAQKAVLVALADHARDDGTRVFPGVERLTLKTSYAERTVRRALSDLRQMGLIHVVREATYHRPTEYIIDLPEMQARQNRPARDAGHDLPESPTDLPESAERPARDAPKPSLNPKEPLQQHDGDSNFAEACAAYEDNIGMLSPIISEKIMAAVDEYPDGWVVDAISIAAEANKRNLRYVKGILRNWHQKGYQDTGKNGHSPYAEEVTDESGGYNI